MKSGDFLKDKALYITSHSIVAVFTFLILWALNPSGGFALSYLIGILYIIGAVLPLIFEYNIKKNFYQGIISIFSSLDKKNLIAEMVEPPSFIEGQIFYDMLKDCNKAMIEEINRYRYLEEDYREYMELWIHEIKTPIASSKLVAQNNKNEVTDSILEELQKIESFVEQVLFYSRSNNVEKDYIIKEINLQKLCFDVIKKNSKLFIQNRIKVETDNLDMNVLCDAKWLDFILNQILTNSVKYSGPINAEVRLTVLSMENGIMLSVSDNGVGILKSELPRIFDKGFTGTNGRKNERSTGMGLYICKKLCDKLGLSITAHSESGEGTTISIVFPKSSMMDVM